MRNKTDLNLYNLFSNYFYTHTMLKINTAQTLKKIVAKRDQNSYFL
jgi:hypothetical protein